MAGFSFDGQDPILPIRIIHNSEQIWNGKRLEQNYNYLLYAFETEQHTYQARAYLDEIHTVAVYGPFKKGDADLLRVEGIEIDGRILAYLRRRYAEIRRFGPSGYVAVA